MKISKLDAQELNHQEMIKLNGGQYFKPSIDGSMLVNERVTLRKGVYEEEENTLFIHSFVSWLFD